MGLSTQVLPGTPWSKAAIAFLREFYREYDTRWVAEQLGRFGTGVRGKANGLGLKKHPHRDVWCNHVGATDAFRKFRKKFKE